MKKANIKILAKNDFKKVIVLFDMKRVILTFVKRIMLFLQNYVDIIVWFTKL